MDIERANAVTFKGAGVTLIGPEIRAGQPAPDFQLPNTDLVEVSLKDFRGKVVLLTSVPSLDTPVCDLETRRFNQEVGQLGDRVQLVTVSMDLPFAQKRWCGAAGADHVMTLSDFRHHAFGHSYGVYMKDIGLLARAVFVIDQQGTVRYAQYVPEVTSEPDYQRALAAVQECLSVAP
jgi:thiol peroxidase